MKRASCECVGIEAACAVLANSASVRAMMAESLGARRLGTAIRPMRAGRLDTPLGAEVRSVLQDAIRNESAIVWSGVIPGDDTEPGIADADPIEVLDYHGICWIRAPAFEPARYVLTEADARAFVAGNSPDARETDDDDGCVRCPFCRADDGCDHLLLWVDLTFREVLGGVLFDAFRSRWRDLVAQADESGETENGDDDSASADRDLEWFEQLLDDVRSLADSTVATYPDSAPGMSSHHLRFFWCSARGAEAAARPFAGW